MSINDIIKERYPHEQTQKIADDLELSYGQVCNRAYKMGLKKTQEFLNSPASGRGQMIKAGIAYRYKPGNVSWNKGGKMSDDVYIKAAPTMFKKGNRPNNWKTNGTIVIRLDKSGRKYKYIKISDSNWQLYHRYLWEQAFGQIPKNSKLIFKNGDSSDCDLNNLELITLAEAMNRNTIHRYPAELKEIIKLNKKLIKKINGKEQNQ